MLLEQFHGAAAAVEVGSHLYLCRSRAVSAFPLAVVELGLMLFEPGFAGGRDLRRAFAAGGAPARSLTREDVQQSELKTPT